MQLLGVFLVLIISLVVDYPDLRQAKKERKVLIIYGVLMLLTIIVSLEIVFNLDVFNPNVVIENLIKNYIVRGSNL